MAETRLTPTLDLEGMSPEEAFSILGNETRLDIVRILWTAGALHEYDDLDDSATTMSFSELRRRADIDDNGQFNYHLSKLRPQFVRKTDDGYRLSGAGKKLARTVVAISGQQSPEISDEVRTDCPMCGGTVMATYDDQWLRFECTECDGLFGDAVPEGTLLNSPFPPAGAAARPPDDALRTGLFRCMLDLGYMMQGVCRECAGPVSGSVSVCHDHTDGEDPCEGCGSYFAAWGELRCETCRFAKRLPVEVCIMGLTPVVAFLYTQDINLLAPTLEEVVTVLRTQVETTVHEDPFHMTVTVETGGETLTLVLDEQLSVLDVSPVGTEASS